MRIAILILLIFLAYRIFRGHFLRGDKRHYEEAVNNSKNSAGTAEEMVEDPQCGLFIQKSRAIKIRTQGRVLYFCSEKCRDEYLSKNA